MSDHDQVLPDLHSFAAALTHADIDVDRLVVDAKGTICSPDARPLPGSADGSQPTLPVLTGDGGEIDVKEMLSRGGMGTIMRAEQHSIGRDVAVKVAAPGKRGTLAEAELVVEARVAGQLEHPNIVPVHLLGMTADRKPIIVMKRIEGKSWRELLAVERNLPRDLDVLADVCRALHFAHARGVVHRDVKPANVMVGSFGEVYLLDWGIAVGFGDNALPDLPHARIVTTVSGTPKYMAPEMALPKCGTVDQRTDVFLIGAVLHEIITGVPPHTGNTVAEMLFAAHTGAPPSYGADVPKELAAICQKAMQRDPAARFQSAEEVRLAIVAFQSHTVARSLCETAEERLAQMMALPPEASAQRLFTESRFGFSQALRTWPESTRATEGLERAVTSMAMRELASGHYDSASLLASELEHVPAELAAALSGAKEKQEKAAANVVQLEKFAHERDQRIGSPERALVVFVAGVVWLSTQTGLELLSVSEIYRAAGGSFALCLGVIGCLIAGAGIAFPHIRTTTSARSLFLTMLICDLSIGALFLTGWIAGIATAPILALGHIILAATIAILASQDGRLWLATAFAVASVPLVLFFEAHVYFVSGVTAFAALAAWAKKWRELA